MDWNRLQQETILNLLSDNTLEELEALAKKVGLLSNIMCMGTPATDEAIAQRNKMLFFERCLELAIAHHKNPDNQPQA
tara:strand:+ start:1170 stop:1403 length:234 start_codon:yes stop_codon:yes gene_type:complete